MKFIISTLTALSLFTGCTVVAPTGSSTAPVVGSTTSQVVIAAIPAAVSASTYIYLTKAVQKSNLAATKTALVAVATALNAYVTTGQFSTPAALQQYLQAAVPTAQYVYASAAINFVLSE